jgi:ubiquinone/menaquinone biosynthesis C-methylase UbiE
MSEELKDYMIVTRDFYETNALLYAANTAEMLDREWLEQFASLLPPGARVLDAGCAGGRDAQWFVARDFDVVGIDIASSFVEIAGRNAPNAEFRVASVTSLPFEAESFHGVWCSCVLIHLKKSDASLAVSEMSRVLKPGGTLYILVKSGNSEEFEADARYGGMIKFNSYFTEEEMRDMLRGFEMVAFRSVDKPVDAYRAPDRMFMLARKL